MCNISNLTATNCASNAAGVKGKQYMCPAEEFTAWPDFLATTGVGDTVTLDGNFTLTGDLGLGYFRSFPCLPEKGSYSITAVGPAGSKTFEEKFIYSFSGISAAQLEHIKNLANIPGVWLCTDKENVVHVLGSKDDPAYVESIEGTTGTAAADERAVTVTIRNITSSPAVYTGTINTTPAD